MSIITELAQQAKQAARTLAILDESQKNAVLTDMAAAIRANKDKIIAVNEKEVARAKENNLDAAMIDRLILDDERIESIFGCSSRRTAGVHGIRLRGCWSKRQCVRQVVQMHANAKCFDRI